ncbi:hypothetical protein ACP4OV_009148 [Aristida adscensionis]
MAMSACLLVMPQSIPVASAPSTGGGDGAMAISSGKIVGGDGGVELPLHLTEEILRCISPLQSARFATVCKSWAATVAARLARPVPHLFVYTAPSNASDRRGLIVPVRLDGGDARRLPPAATPARVRSADTNGMRCVGATPGGRLAFASAFGRSAVVVNPVTGAAESIEVGMPRWSRRDNALAVSGTDALFSVDVDGIALWRRAGDGKAWSKQTVAADRTDDIWSAAYSDGCFYMLHLDGYMSKIDAAAAPPLRAEELPVANLFHQLVRADADADGGGAIGAGHLLESDGEVLFVAQLVADDKQDAAFVFCEHQRGFSSIVGFRVYKLDGDGEGRRWARVARLGGDRAVFVSPESSFTVRASETAGCRSNCIYFVGNSRFCHDCNRSAGTTWGVYSMDDRRVLFEHAATQPGPCSAALWFLPSVA